MIAITQLANPLTADGCEGVAAPRHGTPNPGAASGRSCASPLTCLPRGETLAADGAVVFAKACELGLEGNRVEAAGQLLQERQKPELVETVNPDFERTEWPLP